MNDMAAGGLLAESLGRKLVIGYLVMFVLPVSYLVASLVQDRMVSAAVGERGLSLVGRGLLIGVPAIAVMSLGGLLLLAHSLRHLKDLKRQMEKLLREDLAVELPTTASCDETQLISSYVSCIVDSFRSEIMTLGDRAKELCAANEQLVQAAMLDPLTGLPNREHAIRTLEGELHRAVRHGTALSVLLIDVDDFDQLRESLRPAQLEMILREVGALVGSATRRLDMVARFDESRFFVLLLDANLDSAVRVGERIRQATAERSYRTGRGTGDSTDPAITVSVGVGTYDDAVLDAGKLIRRAEASLALGRQVGRNIVWA